MKCPCLHLCVQPAVSEAEPYVQKAIFTLYSEDKGHNGYEQIRKNLYAFNVEHFLYQSINTQDSAI